MKKLFFFLSISLFVVLFANASYAQDLRNASGSKTGKIESDGTVRNQSGSKIGKIESDGTIRNASGSKVGSAKGVKKQWAAVTFFFY